MMSDFDFIAWSLAAGGIFCVAIIGTARVVQLISGKPFYRPEPAKLGLALFISLMVGGLGTCLALELATQIQPPRWSALLMGVTALVSGVWDLRFGKPHNWGWPSTKTLGWVLLIVGLLSLSLNLYHLASSGASA